MTTNGSRKLGPVTSEEVQALVGAHLRRRLPADVELGEASAFDELGLSSLQLVDVVATLEERHGFRFDPRILEARTLGDLTALANEALANPAPGDGPLSA